MKLERFREVFPDSFHRLSKRALGSDRSRMGVSRRERLVPSFSYFNTTVILLIIQGCPDRVIKSITMKPNILPKTLFHRSSPKFIKV